MDGEARGDVLINGGGTAVGGVCRTVRINGAGRISGDVDCQDCTTNGSAVLQGDLRTENLRINGAGEVTGSAEVGRGHVRGNAKVGGDLKGKTWVVNGVADVGGSVGAERLEVYGGIEVGRDCEVEVLEVRGWLTVRGMLNADAIDVALFHRNSAVNAIGGADIRIHAGRRLLVPARLVADTIEGDDIELENTTAKAVRGARVVIGKGCDIGNVEYHLDLTVDPSAKVAQQKQI